MVRKFMKLLAAITVVSAGMLLAQTPATNPTKAEGTVMVQGKNYSFKYALAYETTVDDAEVIAVVLSGQKISGEKLSEAKERDKEGQSPDFTRPYIMLEFTKAGELTHWSAGVGNTSLGRRSGNAKGELKVANGRVIGKASQPNETEGMFPSGFDVSFDVPLLGAGDSLPPKKKPGPAANVKPTVTGTFKGNGKDVKLAYVSAHWREPFDDKPSIVLVFSEKDHSKDKKPDFNAAFGKFGSALIISVHEDGSIFGCQVVHTALEKQGFTALGQAKIDDFTFEDGKVEGELTTDGPDDVFGETWDVKVKFVVPLGEIPAEFQPAEKKKALKDSSDDDEEATVPSEKSTAQPAANQLNAKDLALTKDATDAEYNALVGHISFKSKAGVKSACTELAANLKAQGWANDGSDLITAQSSILKRKRGEATLTIFVKPEAGGSQVKMFTEGLAWDGQ